MPGSSTVQVISGTGLNGQVKGILALGAGNLITTTYTDASPTTGEVYGKIAETMSGLTAARYAPPSVIVMHPRRWAWMLSARDADGRPLVLPGSNGPTNSQGVQTALDGNVGSLLGSPVFVDPSIPVNLGGGTNEDRILLLKSDDLWLWEGAIRTRVMPEVGSGTLTTRLQIYNCVAFSGERQNSSAVISGSGLITPVFS